MWIFCLPVATQSKSLWQYNLLTTIVYCSKQVLTLCDHCSSFQTATCYYNLICSNTIQPSDFFHATQKFPMWIFCLPVATQSKSLWQYNLLTTIVYCSKQVLTLCDHCPSFQTATFYYNLICSNTIQPFVHSFKACVCSYMSFFTRYNRSGRESTCSPLFHLGKSQSTSCTHCSDLNRMSGW